MFKKLKQNIIKEKKHEKISFLAIILLVVICVMGACSIKKGESQEGEENQEEYSQIENSVKIVADCIREGYSGEYGAVYRGVRSRKELSKEDRETVQSGIIDRFAYIYAFENFAKKHDIMPSKKEVEAYAKTQIKEAEDSKTFDEISPLLKKYNLSVEDFVCVQDYYYQWQNCISDKVSKYLEAQHDEEVEREQVISEMLEITKKYKKTDEGKSKLKVIESYIDEIYEKVYEE